jgi:hypothetical protein
MGLLNNNLGWRGDTHRQPVAGQSPPAALASLADFSTRPFLDNFIFTG